MATNIEKHAVIKAALVLFSHEIYECLLSGDVEKEEYTRLFSVLVEAHAELDKFYGEKKNERRGAEL